jgi:hypothetical protein
MIIVHSSHSSASSHFTGDTVSWRIATKLPPSGAKAIVPLSLEQRPQSIKGALSERNTPVTLFLLTILASTCSSRFNLPIVLLDYDGAGSATHGRTYFNHDLVWDPIEKRWHSQALRTVPQTIHHHLHQITLLNPARLQTGAIQENRSLYGRDTGIL